MGGELHTSCPEDDLSYSSCQGLIERVPHLPELHGIDQTQIDAFVNAVGVEGIPPVESEPLHIADLFCGTGFAISTLIERLIQARLSSHLHLIDMHQCMLSRALISVNELIPEDHRSLFTINTYKQEILEGSSLPFEDSALDVVVIKMGLHEIPLKDQASLVSEVYRVLKPRGRFVIWENLIPKDPQTLEDLNGFNTIIRKKDALAGYELMAERRYFTSQEELFYMLGVVGFHAQLVYSWIRQWDSLGRFEIELGGDEEKLRALNAEIDRHFIDETLRQHFNYRVTHSEEGEGPEGRCFEGESGIILAQKIISP